MDLSFNKQPWVTFSKLILSSTVPVLKLTADILIDVTDNPKLNVAQKAKRKVPPFCIDLSIQCRGTQNHLGMQSTQFVKDILAANPTLRSIMLLVKIFLKARSFHMTYLGGMNSYVLFLLLYAVYKHRKLN